MRRLDNYWPAVCAVAVCAAGALLGVVVGLLYVVIRPAKGSPP